MKLSEANKLRLLYFLVFCCTASWLPIFADYLKDHGLDGIKTAIILSVTPCMMFAVQPFVGMLADKFGYKKCLLIASFFSALSYFLYLINGGFIYLFVITICMSFFYNTIQPLLDSLSLQLAQDDPKFSYGSLRIAGAAGWSFTGIIVGQFIDSISTTVIFISAGISMFLCFCFSFFIGHKIKLTASTENVGRKNFKKIISNNALLILLAAVFLVSAGATTIWNFYSLYMKENGASAALVGYGISFQGLCELPLFYFSAKIIARLGIKNTLLLTIFSTAVRLLLYSIVSNPKAAIAIEVLHGFSWSLFWVVCVEYVNSIIPEHNRAAGQSLLYASYYGIGALAGNLWTGFLYDSHMKIADIFLLNAGIVAVTCAGVWLFIKPVKKY